MLCFVRIRDVSLGRIILPLINPLNVALGCALLRCRHINVLVGLINISISKIPFCLNLCPLSTFVSKNTVLIMWILNVNLSSQFVSSCKSKTSNLENCKCCHNLVLLWQPLAFLAIFISRYSVLPLENPEKIHDYYSCNSYHWLQHFRQALGKLTNGRWKIGNHHFLCLKETVGTCERCQVEPIWWCQLSFWGC